MWIKKNYGLIRCVYLCVFVAYTIFRELVPFRLLVGHNLVVAGVFGLGLLIIAANLWLDRDHTTKANLWIFVAFVGVSAVSTLLNYKFEFMSNVKAILWMALFMFLVYPHGYHSVERKGKDVAAMTTTAFVILTIAVAVSLPMYFFNLQYSYVIERQFDNVLLQGYNKEYFRLWGIFADPNTASVYCFVALVASTYLFAKKKNPAIRTLLVIGDVLILLFIVLSGSRTAKVAIVIACAWVAFYSLYTLLKKKKKLQRIAVSSVALVLAALASYGVMLGTAYILPPVKTALLSACSTQVNKSVHLFYDDAYKASGLNISDGYYVEDKTTVDDGGSGDTDDTGNAGDGGNAGGGNVEQKPGNESIVGRPDLEGKGDLSNGRFAKWEDSLRIFACAPIFGASPRGISAFGKVYCPENTISKYGYAAHNFLLEILTGTGIVGFGLVLLMLFRAAYLIVRATLEKQFSFKYLLHSTILLTLVCSSLFLSDLFFYLTFGGFAFFFSLGFINGEAKYIEKQAEIEEGEKKRILIYGPKDPVGGVEKIVYEYVKNIMEKHPDVAFDFLEYGESFSMEERLTELGCRVFYLPSRKKKYLQYKKAIEKIFSDTPYVAVWGNYSGLTNIDLLVLAKKYRIPVRIAHSHGSRLYWGSRLMKYVVYVLHYCNKLQIKDYATDFWACSQMSGEFTFPKSTELKVVANAVDTDVFYPSKEKGIETRKNIAIAEDALVIGHVARLCEVKNQKYLLNIAKATMQSNENTVLLIVGDGEERNALEEEAKSLGIAEKTVFLGERQDVPALLRAMDVFVLTSFSEGLSVSAVEAQASGVPCVLPTSVSKETDVSGLVQFVSLDEPYTVWAETILQQAQTSNEGVKEEIIKNGYEISTESEKIYKRFVLAE